MLIDEIKSILEKHGYEINPDSMMRIETMTQSLKDDNQLYKLDHIIDWFTKKREQSDMTVEEIGINAAKLHLITKGLKGKRENKLSVNSWRKIYNKVKKDCSKIHPNLPKIVEKNLDAIEKNWPKNIPSGIIHADLFSDNIFFKDDKLSGIIDYYFSCYDFYAFEIAICLNALCFEGKNENLSFNVTKSKKFIDGYSSIRKLTEEEKKSLKVLCQGAAIRFLLTRVFDYLNLTEGAIVKIKDPIEYLKRLEFHDSVKNYQDYFF